MEYNSLLTSTFMSERAYIRPQSTADHNYHCQTVHSVGWRWKGGFFVWFLLYLLNREGRLRESGEQREHIHAPFFIVAELTPRIYHFNTSSYTIHHSIVV